MNDGNESRALKLGRLSFSEAKMLGSLRKLSAYFASEGNTMIAKHVITYLVVLIAIFSFVDAIETLRR
jgi:hypothetical protein